MSDLLAWEFQLAQSGLEMLETFRIVDADLHLGRVSKISPSLAAIAHRGPISYARWGAAIEVESQVLLLRGAGAGEQVVENVEVTLSRWYHCHSAAFQSVVQDFTTNECRVDGRGGVILKLEE